MASEFGNYTFNCMASNTVRTRKGSILQRNCRTRARLDRSVELPRFYLHTPAERRDTVELPSGQQVLPDVSHKPGDMIIRIVASESNSGTQGTGDWIVLWDVSFHLMHDLKNAILERQGIVNVLRASVSVQNPLIRIHRIPRIEKPFGFYLCFCF